MNSTYQEENERRNKSEEGREKSERRRGWETVANGAGGTGQDGWNE